MRFGLQPLTDLDEAAALIGSGDLSVRAPHSNEAGEVGHLSRTFNGMAERIEAAFREQRESQIRLQRFVADASHELRTPLTSIRAYAELLGKGVLPADPRSRQASQRIEAEAERMSALVNDLLLLARLDEQGAREPARVDLGRLVAGDDERYGRDRPYPRSHMQRCIWRHREGDESQLRQLVGNLLRNAVVHTPPGTFVEASVRTLGSEVSVVVGDGGPGMSAEVAEHAFERFFRPEPGRTRGSGTGLGLAIVDAVASSHGGSVALEYRPGKGTRFTVPLPSAPALEPGTNPKQVLRSSEGRPRRGPRLVLDASQSDQKGSSRCSRTYASAP